MRNKPQLIYVMGVLVILMMFSNRSYNDIGKLSFIVPAIIVSLLIGVIGVYLFGEDMRLYKNLYFISYILTIGFAFVPVIGVYNEDGNSFYGFPAQWFSYYPSGYVSLELLGFLFNYFLIYLTLNLLIKLLFNFSKHNNIKVSQWF